VNVAGSGGFLPAWIDFDGNGAFDGPVEQIATDLQDTDGDGTILIPVSVPGYATTTQTFARFRWSTDPNIDVDGRAPDGEVEDYAFVFGGTGPQLAGRIFLDNGAGGATAYDATLSAGETAGAFASVLLTDSGGNVLATPDVQPDGTWSAVLAQGFTGSVTVTATPAAGYRSISEASAGLPSLSDAGGTDGTFTFTPAAGTSYTALDFGLITEPLLTQNQTASLTPGQIVDLTHRYEATAPGTVTFALTDLVSLPAGAFSSTGFRDTNCDGAPDAALNSGIAVVAGQSICLVVRTQTSNGVGANASHTYGLTALTDFTGTGVTSSLRNDDTINNAPDAQISLRKLVRNVTAGTPETTSNTGSIGDELEYRLIISNLSGNPTSNVRVVDTTPAWTALSIGITDNVTIAPGVTCTVVTPAGGGSAGYAGPLEWTCPGTLPPGTEASLTFSVRIQ
jgi:uncharacterized repeat protein (TIGR01451 family)